MECGRTKTEAIVVPLVVRDAPADRFGAAGFSEAAAAFIPWCAHAEGRIMCSFDVVVVLHGARCRKTIPVLQQYFGMAYRPRGMESNAPRLPSLLYVNPFRTAAPFWGQTT